MIIDLLITFLLTVVIVIALVSIGILYLLWHSESETKQLNFSDDYSLYNAPDKAEYDLQEYPDDDEVIFNR